MSNDLALFFTQTIGLGLATGFIIGYVFKKISKLIIIILGIILIVSQIMVYNGIIDIDWGLIESVTKPLFENKDLIFGTIKGILLINIPFAASTGLGLVLGLKKG